jgi:hypothetical protein
MTTYRPLDDSLARRVGRGREDQILDAARVARELEVGGEESSERGEESAREARTIELIHRVHEAELRGPKGRLVEHALHQLPSPDDHLILPLILPERLRGRLSLELQVERGQPGREVRQQR